MTFNQILGQIVGIIALSFLVSTYFKKDKASITKTMIVSNIFYIIHYFLIGALSGSYALIIAIFRDYYIYLRESCHKKHRHHVIYNNVFIFLGIFTIFVSLILLNIENPINIFPFVAGLFYFIFEWFGNKFSVKLATGISSCFWAVYDIINFSIPGILTDTFSISACFLGLKKDYDRRHKRHKK